MIVFEGVTKIYNDVKALDNLNLTINDGEIFGLIGHNGAGKSTTIKSLVSVIEPEFGNIFVNNMLLSEHRDEIKRMIGYVSDSPDKFLKMEALDFWEFIGMIYGIEEDVLCDRIEKLTEIFEIADKSRVVIEQFSHGMRQKVFVIGALLPNPSIWVLDEPLTGLDPQSSFNLKEMMKKHSQRGNTVIFSTHVLEVAEQLCDRVGILKKGQLIFVGTMEELKKLHPGESLEKIYLDMVNVKKDAASSAYAEDYSGGQKYE